MREAIDVLGQSVGVEPLDSVEDPTVQLSPAFLEQAAVGYLVRERVLEGVFRVRKEGRLVDELRRLQMREAAAQFLLRLPGDGGQQRECDILADDGGRLKEALVLRREAIDASRQDGLDGRRNLDVRERPGQPIRPAFTCEHPRLDESADALLEEQWVPLGPLDQPRLQRIKRGALAEETPEQLANAFGRQRIEPELRVVGPRAPAMFVLWAVVDEEEDACGGEALDEAIEEGLGLTVDPVQVLEDQEQRLHLALAQQQPLDRIEGALPALRGIEGLPAGVVDGDVQQGEEGMQRVGEGLVQSEELAGDFLADLPRVVPVPDLEVDLEEIDNRKIDAGPAVGDGAGFEDQPVVNAMGMCNF